MRFELVFCRKIRRFNSVWFLCVVMAWKLVWTFEFEKRLRKLDPFIQRRIEKEIRQVEQNPFVGKPLSFRFLREKKVLQYRVYYLIYEEFVVVFVVGLSDKKDQPSVIAKIKSLMPLFYEEIRKKFT